MLFVAGNLITAIAPNMPVALAARIVTSLTHGAFFGIGSILAAELVAPDKRVRAIAFMFSGLALATLVGVPAGTWLSQLFSWRATFYAITLIGIVALLATAWLVPATKAGGAVPVRQELAAFGNLRVLLAFGITIFGPAAFFTSITYIAPRMTDVAGFPESAVVWAFGFATVSPIQKLVLDKAAAAGAPTLAASVNIGLFNLGNAIGALVGGWVISAGLGLVAPNWAGGILSLAALAFALATGDLDRRDARLVAQPA